MNPYYKYFLLGDVTPVRVTFNEMGLRSNAETPDPNGNSLLIKPTLMSRIEISHEVDEIDQGEFERRCEEIYASKKLEHAPGGMG